MSRNAARPPGLRHIAGIPGDQVTPCFDEPDLFFPPGTSWDGHGQQAADAKAACKRCPLIEPCLRWALDTREPFAIAGGMTPRERRRLGKPKTERDLGETDCGTRKGYEQHRRRGEQPCDPCRIATNAYNVAYRAARRAAS